MKTFLVLLLSTLTFSANGGEIQARFLKLYKQPLKTTLVPLAAHGSNMRLEARKSVGIGSKILRSETSSTELTYLSLNNGQVCAEYYDQRARGFYKTLVNFICVDANGRTTLDKSVSISAR